MIRVLVFGKTPALMPRALAALRAAGFEPEAAFDAAAVTDRLAAGGISAVAIGGGVGAAERQAVHAAASGLPVVDVFGPENLVPDVKRALSG